MARHHYDRNGNYRGYSLSDRERDAIKQADMRDYIERNKVKGQGQDAFNKGCAILIVAGIIVLLGVFVYSRIDEARQTGESGKDRLASSLITGTLAQIGAKEHLSCDQVFQRRSAPSAQPANLTITNHSAHTIDVDWVDFTGRREYRFALGPGESNNQPTFVGHVWVITDMSGRCLQAAIAPSRVEVR